LSSSSSAKQSGRSKTAAIAKAHDVNRAKDKIVQYEKDIVEEAVLDGLP
jgi:hypothetical protein